MYHNWLNKKRTSRQSLSIVVSILIFGLCFSGALAFVLHKGEDGLLATKFNKDVKEQAISLAKELEVNVEALHSMSLLFNQFQPPNLIRFQEEARKIIDRRPAIEALIWAPTIPVQKKTSFTEDMQPYYPGFAITEFNSNNEYVTASDRDEYYPIYYMEPRARS